MLLCDFYSTPFRNKIDYIFLTSEYSPLSSKGRAFGFVNSLNSLNAFCDGFIEDFVVCLVPLIVQAQNPRKLVRFNACLHIKQQLLKTDTIPK